MRSKPTSGILATLTLWVRLFLFLPSLPRSHLVSLPTFYQISAPIHSGWVLPLVLPVHSDSLAPCPHPIPPRPSTSSPLQGSPSTHCSRDLLQLPPLLHQDAPLPTALIMLAPSLTQIQVDPTQRPSDIALSHIEKEILSEDLTDHSLYPPRGHILVTPF